MLLLFCALLVFAAWMPRGRDLHEKRARMVAIAIGFGLFLAWMMPNYWLAAYTVIFLAGLFRVPSPADRLPLTVYPSLLVAALYVILAPIVTVAWVAPVLWSLTACGLVLTSWWAFSMYKSQGHYDTMLTWNKKVLVHLYEHQPVFNPVPMFCCGQGNTNFSQALAGACTAAAMGLMVLGSRWAIPAFLLCALPLIKIKGQWNQWPEPSQGWGYLALILIAGSGSIGFLVGSVVLGTVTALSWQYRPALWSGRQEMWTYGYQVWKSMSWKGKLIGAGPESWIHIFQQDAERGAERIKQQKAFATHAHNEFVHDLVERGALGVFCLVGYLCTTGWALMGAGPEAHAVLILGAFLVACACVSFPWSNYHEVAFLAGGAEVSGHGMPILNMISLACVLLTEGVLR